MENRAGAGGPGQSQAPGRRRFFCCAAPLRPADLLYPLWPPGNKDRGAVAAAGWPQGVYKPPNSYYNSRIQTIRSFGSLE